jgi:hypothetical protein
MVPSPTANRTRPAELIPSRKFIRAVSPPTPRSTIVCGPAAVVRIQAAMVTFVPQTSVVVPVSP